jgi:hypothetical protein
MLRVPRYKGDLSLHAACFIRSEALATVRLGNKSEYRAEICLVSDVRGSLDQRTGTVIRTMNTNLRIPSHLEAQQFDKAPVKNKNVYHCL